MKLFNVAFISLFFVSVPTLAHEGHDHDSPRGIVAPKGGVIKSLEETSIEVVAKGNDLFLYFYDHNMKPQSVLNYQVKAKAEMPRTKKQEDIPLVAKETWFEATYDAKGSHRYTLIVSFRDPKMDHDDQLKYTIEPKK